MDLCLKGEPSTISYPTTCIQKYGVVKEGGASLPSFTTNPYTILNVTLKYERVSKVSSQYHVGVVGWRRSEAPLLHHQPSTNPDTTI